MCSSWTRPRCLDVSIIRDILSVLQHTSVCMCVCPPTQTHSHGSFSPSSSNLLSTNLWSSHLLLFLSPPLSLQPITHVVFFFYWNLYYSSQSRPPPRGKKHEVKTDVGVCCGHAKQLKSECDISSTWAMHILLDKPRYQHSPSIKLICLSAALL